MAVRIENEDRVIARDIAVFFGREVNVRALADAALKCGIDLGSRVDFERQVLDPDFVIAVGATVSRAETEHRAPRRLLEIDDLLRAAIGRLANLLSPAEWAEEEQVEPQRSLYIGDRKVNVVNSSRRDRPSVRDQSS
jgi:hypothetical protein